MLVIPDLRRAHTLHNFDCPTALTVLPSRRASVTTDLLQMRSALQPRSPAAGMESGRWNRSMARVRERHHQKSLPASKPCNEGIATQNTEKTGWPGQPIPGSEWWHDYLNQMRL